MPIKLVMSMPAHAVESLMEGYRRGDPELQGLLRDFGVLAIIPEDEDAMRVWENEGGICR
jgi:hypothetical protein